MATELMELTAARARILAAARPLGAERIALRDAAGRVLAEDLVAAGPLPPFDHSAMDGYALRLADWSVDAWLPISQRIPAGHIGGDLARGTAARIFTGAPVPPGAQLKLTLARELVELTFSRWNKSEGRVIFANSGA